jgi:hypothetical protein
MRRISRLALSLVTAPLLQLAACGGDAADPARFAGATELQQQRAVSRAAGEAALV